jgi:hypothetical protein
VMGVIARVGEQDEHAGLFELSRSMCPSRVDASEQQAIVVWLVGLIRIANAGRCGGVRENSAGGKEVMPQQLVRRSREIAYGYHCFAVSADLVVAVMLVHSQLHRSTLGTG